MGAYFGSKTTSGLYQPIIALTAPHETYIESHLGGGAIMKRKPPALCDSPGLLTSPNQAFDFWNDLEQVCDQADVGDLEDRCLGVPVDRDNGARVLDARQMLDGP